MGSNALPAVQANALADGDLSTGPSLPQRHLQLVPESAPDMPSPGGIVVPLRLSTHPPSLYPRVGKRLVDIVGSLALLVLLSPLFLAIAIWIPLDSRGGAIYRQRRVGLARRSFTIYKFRTMIDEADVLVSADPAIWTQYAANWKLVDDPRVTGCGKFLRSWSLDELPQLVNVIKGDMSLVGPRPYMPHELSGEFGSHAAHIASIRPGMTGLWQVSGRSNLSPHNRIELDETYVNVCGFWYDLRILAQTVKVVFLRTGAR